MKLGPSFEYILKRRRMDFDDLSERTNIPVPLLEQAIVGENGLADHEVKEIADALGVPERALFAKQTFPLAELPDFRKKTPSETTLDEGVMKAVAYIERVSLSLAALGIDVSIADEVSEYQGEISKSAAKELARIWRQKWGLAESLQLQWGDANKVYADLRQFIERKGIFVMHFSFGEDEVAGLYSRVDAGPHVIAINTYKSSKARKLFTLAHEFCHVLLRKRGISNPSIARNRVEVFCNQFAAHLLAPDGLVKQGLKRYKYTISIDNESIRLLAKNLGISQQACILRLVEMNFLDDSDYVRWIGRFKGITPDGDQFDSGGGGGDSDPIQNKRTQYGASFLSKLSLAKKDGLLDTIEIYRLAGIKPRYQGDLLGA